jgi:tetratricopeptide repeat protein
MRGSGRAPALFVVALIALASCDGGASTSGVASAQRARELFDRGQFRESHELLRQVIAQSGPSLSLLYNLGCALYRDGRLGEAVAAWESARLLSPRDPDLLHNLGIAAGRQVDRLPEVERSALERLLARLCDGFSLDQWTLIVCGLYFLLLTAIGTRLFLNELRARDHWATVVFVLATLWVLGLLGFGRAWATFHQTRAVVTAEETSLQSGPDGSGEKVATLHAGLIVEITGAAGQDRQVRLSTGWQGFAPAKALQPIGLEVWTQSGGAAPEIPR